MQIQNQNQIFLPEILASGPSLPEVPPPEGFDVSLDHQYINLAWSWPGNEAGILFFEIRYGPDPDNPTNSDTVAPSERAWTFTADTAELEMFFRVFAVVDPGAGIYSPAPPEAGVGPQSQTPVDYLIPDGQVANANFTATNWHTITGNDSGDGGDLVFDNNDKLTGITLDNISSANSVLINDNDLLTSVGFAALATVTGSFSFLLNGSFANTLQFNPGASMSFGQLAVTDNALLPSLTFTNTITFTNVSAPIIVESNPSLTTITVDDEFFWTDGATVSFAGNALTSAAVNNRLDNALNGNTLTSGTLDLSGGTNGAPTGQGIIDKAALQANGVTVNTN